MRSCLSKHALTMGGGGTELAARQLLSMFPFNESHGPRESGRETALAIPSVDKASTLTSFKQLLYDRRQHLEFK